MRVLVVGSGGREHALAWKIAQEAEVFCTPGNAGVCQECTCFDTQATDVDGIVRLSREAKADLVVVGPEDPLIAGLADALRAAGVCVFGPAADAARLEASKAWSKSVMSRAGVPTARFGTFRDVGEASDFVRSRFASGLQVVVKASGAALGKGVVVCREEAEALDAVEGMLSRGEWGEAGTTVVVEDRLEGREFSLLTLVSGTSFHSLPVAQDYKRARDGDQGPNTGGMGSYSPVPWVSADLVERAEATVVAPVLQALADEGVDYRGVLFSGLLVQDGTPYCLEYNVRFGDPETQSVLSRLGTGFVQALVAVAEGRPVPPVPILDQAAVTVVVASGGYPGAYAKGLDVEIGEMPAGARVFHAGTARRDGRTVTSGGRVLGVTATAPSVALARDLAYQAVSNVSFEGAHFRRDIAADAS